MKYYSTILLLDVQRAWSDTLESLETRKTSYSEKVQPFNRRLCRSSQPSIIATAASENGNTVRSSWL